MKKALHIYSILFVLLFTSITTQAAWFNNYNAAVKAAQRKNLPILADVSGKNWCIWCERLNKEVFDTTKFKKFARKNLVLLLIDVPNPSSPSREAKLFMKKYPVKGFPTVFLLDSNGKVLYKTGYLSGGPANYIKALKPFIKIAPAPSKVAAKTSSKPKTNKQEPQTITTPTSKDKITKLNMIIQDYYDSGSDIKDESVQNIILVEVNEDFTVDKNFKINKISEFEIEQLAAKLKNEKYPDDLNTLKQIYRQQAEKKYFSVSKNDNITVKYKRGKTLYTAKGIFYGYTMSGNGIIIGRKTIPVYDLLPKSKYLFSDKLCEEARNRYVKNNVHQYLQEKSSFIDTQKTVAKKILIRENEDAGYIQYNNKWLSPNDVAQFILHKKTEQQMNEGSEIDLGNFFQTEKDNTKFFVNFKPNINPYILISLVISMAILGVCSFVCLIISFVRMFQNKKTAIALICIFLSIFSGIGTIIAFIYSWVKVSEFGIKKLMKFWTYCWLLQVILTIVFIWQCFSALLPLITKQ